MKTLTWTLTLLLVGAAIASVCGNATLKSDCENCWWDLMDGESEENQAVMQGEMFNECSGKPICPTPCEICAPCSRSDCSPGNDCCSECN